MPEIRPTGSNTSLFTWPLLELDEFVPVVKVDPVHFNSARKAAHFQGAKVDLSPIIDQDKRTITMDVIVASPGNMLVTCTVVKARGSTLDDDGVVTPKLAGKAKGVTVQAMDRGKAAYGDPYQFSVEIKGVEDRTFRIDLFANDDVDDTDAGEFKDVHCGRVEVRTWQDVFSEFEANRLVAEINHLKPKVEKDPPDAEYAGNYCMCAAERGLSKLLENTTEFYAVDASDVRLNEVSHSGKSAKNQGEKFKQKGFVKSTIVFKDYVIDHTLRKATTDETTYQANKYSVISLPKGSALDRDIRKTLDGKPGFHVFYISVSDEFHTLLLVIDNRTAGREYYAIYDQHGLTSSHGALADIEAGFARQTSWTFLNYYRNKGFKPDVYCGVTTRLWKIQRKS